MSDGSCHVFPLFLSERSFKRFFFVFLPCREAITRATEDLFSPRFDLLIPCPNAINGLAVNTGSYLPNPAHKTPLATSMLEFLGRFMGLSLRTKAFLPFAFPSLVWKVLAGERPAFSDLRAMDSKFAELLTDLRNCHVEGRSNASGTAARPLARNQEEFAKIYGSGLSFTVLSSSGEEIELVAGGRDIALTFANRFKFCDAAERFRLHEFDSQLAAIRRGLANIVPIGALRLFTASELETLVCGSDTIDVDFLRKHTTYEGYSESHETIKLFWQVLTEFSQPMRSGYLRFVWGRTRLPSVMPYKHKISRVGTGEKSLPASHTCFCAIDLPEYKTAAAMRWGLTTAMTWGAVGILNG